jgi:RNA polymerase sigma-70 factor, ECF subfamily
MYNSGTALPMPARRSHFDPGALPARRAQSDQNRLPARRPNLDPDLIAAIANGDSSAMRALFHRHKLRVFRFVMRLVGDETAAEDIVSEVFLEVWRHADRFAGRSRVSTWMLAIARYKALSARRHLNATLDVAAAEDIADHADTPEDVILRADQSSHLRACLKQLSHEHREIIDLVYYHGRTVEEVAEITKAPKNTVKTRMFYARKQLARLIAAPRRSDAQEAAA